MTAADELLRPYEPDRSAPFDDRRAAHLLRRAGLGVPSADLERARRDGPSATVTRLVAVRNDPKVAELDDVVAPLCSGEDVDGLAAWWVARMLRTDDPLREKLALFWHGHFATSNAKVQDARQMAGQLRLFLDHGRGPFGPLLARVAEDPAMLSWLDGERNRKGHPNENFARELFELFTLGIGNYTERDVQEAARALTGWRRAGGRYTFLPGRHDDGEKVVLGRRGRLGQREVLELCLAHEATAARLVRKLFRFFAHPRPPDDVTAAAARRFIEDDLHVGRLLERLFRSRWFFSDEVVEARILSPTEFVVGHLRTLGVSANAKVVERELRRLGQALLRPPSVKGWDGEEAWIHSASMIARIDCAERITKLELPALTTDDEADAAVSALAAEAVRRLLARRVPDEVVGAVEAHVRDTTPDRRRVAAVAAVLALPEASIG